jgi:hypothetical protein
MGKFQELRISCDIIIRKWKKFTICKMISETNWGWKLKYLIFFRIAGPVNPKNPSEGLSVQIWFLKRLGLWPPETDDPLVQRLYTAWSIFYRGFFLYVYTATQLLFFLNVEDLAVSSQSQIFPAIKIY